MLKYKTGERSEAGTFALPEFHFVPFQFGHSSPFAEHSQKEKLLHAVSKVGQQARKYTRGLTSKQSRDFFKRFPLQRGIEAQRNVTWLYVRFFRLILTFARQFAHDAEQVPDGGLDFKLTHFWKKFFLSLKLLDMAFFLC